MAGLVPPSLKLRRASLASPAKPWPNLQHSRHSGAPRNDEWRERPLPSHRNRLAVDILGRELAVFERVALDALLFALLTGVADGFADAEGHEGDVRQMVVDDVVEAARREERLALCDMFLDGIAADQHALSRKAVVIAPDEVFGD